MPAPKFNFIPEKQLNVDIGNGSWKISIINSKATPSIYFPKDMVNALEMDAKYFRFFADMEKKAIGWVMVKGDTNLTEINDARLANKNKQTGAVLFGIGRIIKTLKYPLKDSLFNVEVKTYMTPLIKEPVNYVILPEPTVEISKETDEETNDQSA